MSHLPTGKISNISATLFDQPTDEWQMTEAERCTLAMMLQRIQPVVAIEIGTAQGGSLAVLARHTRHVYSLDIDPTCQARLGHRFSNVTFISGSSRETLPALLAGLQAGNQQLGFILIDGDHSRAGVRQDINNILGFRPVQPLYIIMHDSFNPQCRAGILEAAWDDSPYIHHVEIDFVPGIISGEGQFYRQMWNGFAAALMLPTERKGRVPIKQSYALQFETVIRKSVYGDPRWKFWHIWNSGRSRVRSALQRRSLWSR